MGRIMQEALIENIGDFMAVEAGYIDSSAIRKIKLELLVDTGAALLCLPLSIISKLGLLKGEIKTAMTSNGTIDRQTYKGASVTIMGRSTTLDVMELPEETPPLLGYIALEALDLYPNPREQKLEGNPLYHGKMVIDLL